VADRREVSHHRGRSNSVDGVFAGRAGRILRWEPLPRPQSLLNNALLVFELEHLEGLDPLIPELPLSLPLCELFEQTVELVLIFLHLELQVPTLQDRRRRHMQRHRDGVLYGSLKDLLVTSLFPICTFVCGKWDLPWLDLQRCPLGLGYFVVDNILLLFLRHLNLAFLQQNFPLHVHAEDAGLSLIQGLIMSHIYDLFLEGIFLEDRLGILNEYRGGQ